MKTSLCGAVLLLSVAACQSAPQPVPEKKEAAVAPAPVEQPPLAFNEIKAEDESLLALNLHVDGKVAPNVHDRSLAWTAKVADKTVGSGTANIEPAADGSFSVSLPVTLGASTADLATYQGSDAVEIALEGSVGEAKASKVRAIRTPLLPQMKILTVDATKIATNAIGLTYTISVRNPNLFEVRLNNVKYNAVLNDKTVLSGELPGGRIPAGSETTFDLPAEANPTNCGKDINTIIRKTDLAWGFKGTMTFGEVEVPYDLSGAVKLSK